MTQEIHHGDTYVYGYDKTSQLLNVRKNGAVFETFAYDANGNRKTSTGPTPGTYTTGKGNQLTSDGKYRYTYDAEGNQKTKTDITSGEVTEYSWDHRNRLTKMERRSAGGIVLETSAYVYDPQGRRIAVSENGTATLLSTFDGDNIWADFKSNGSVATRYVLGDSIDEILIRFDIARSLGFYLSDVIGTVRDNLAASGAIVNSTSYSAFGAIQNATNVNFMDRFGFSGREHLQQASLTYYRSRIANVSTGTFLSLDPIGFESDSLNLYGLLNNSPTLGSDPFGTTFADYVVIIRDKVLRVFDFAQLGCNVRKGIYPILIALSFFGNPLNGQKVINAIRLARENQTKIERVCAVVKRAGGGWRGKK